MESQVASFALKTGVTLAPATRVMSCSNVLAGQHAGGTAEHGQAVVDAMNTR